MLRSIFWKPYSHLLIVGDNADWAIDYEARHLAEISLKIGLPAHRIKRMRLNVPQIVHYASQFSVIDESIFMSKNRISIDYFHGRPEQGESFKKCFDSIAKHHAQISRIRVSHRDMEESIKRTGISPEKVRRIPIGVDTEVFTPHTPETKTAARKKFGIPENAVVIGSFQKDGNGWGEGNEPKLIKGPDIFLETVGRLKSDIPNLHILLSGPARGYMKAGLEKLGIPYTHKYAEEADEIAVFYDALDLYLITSREEGGPKSCLDSMAKGIPLVTTRVGQCQDLVKHGENGLMAEIDDVEALHKLCLEALRDSELRKRLSAGGLATASANSYTAQIPLWKEFFSEIMESHGI